MRIAEENRPTGVPEAVVAREFVEKTVRLRDAWVGSLTDKRHISSAIRHVTRLLPGMSHLKRCSGKRLVLAFAAPFAVDDSARPALPTDGNETHLHLRELEALLGSVDNEFDISNFEIVAVPARAPRTKAQAVEASKIWPLNFHPDPYIENTLNGSCFDKNDLRTIDRCLEFCIEAARREARGGDDCSGSAIVFDPKNKQIVSIAASRIDRHPMWHATMLAVDLVARLQGGGAYDLTGDSSDLRKRKFSGSRPELEPPVAYPADLLDIAERNGPTTSGSEIEAGERKSEERSDYLCTNYWAFLLKEPCPLCAMALVHSRVSNIFYGAPNETRGVLGSRALLHAVPGLNHRYRVWRGVREDECRRACNDIIHR